MPIDIRECGRQCLNGAQIVELRDAHALEAQHEGALLRALGKAARSVGRLDRLADLGVALLHALALGKGDAVQGDCGCGHWLSVPLQAANALNIGNPLY